MSVRKPTPLHSPPHPHRAVPRLRSVSDLLAKTVTVRDTCLFSEMDNKPSNSSALDWEWWVYASIAIPPTLTQQTAPIRQRSDTTRNAPPTLAPAPSITGLSA